MKNVNFTDWQDLWLKKDIEGISKKINQFPKFNLVILIEIIIGIFTLALGVISVINNESSFFDREIIIWLIFILVGASIVIPILIYSIAFCIKRKRTSSEILSGKMDVKYYIDIFDNKICNCVMMANTLCESILTSNIIEAQYCICETSYYLNKCIDEFDNMKSMSDQIFAIKGNKKVAPQRLLLLLKLIISIRNEINNKIDELNGFDEKEIINYIQRENEIRRGYLRHFIIYIHNNINGNMGFDSLLKDL